MSSLPRSFALAGFLSPEQAVKRGRKFRRLMIGTEGEANTGKTEFGWSAPGPIQMLALDRNFDGTLDNPNPPPTRSEALAINSIDFPGFTQSYDPASFKPYWQEFYKCYVSALENPDSRTVFLDGDSDSYELQRLAAFGTLTNVKGPVGLVYTEVNAARRIMYRRAWDSGKIFIATNKVKAEYADVLDSSGKQVMDDRGTPKRAKSGKMARQGWDDYEFLWHIQLQHLYRGPVYNKITGKTSEPQFGIKILMCKANKALEGDELWGSDCNFRSLVEYVYPQVPLSEWGF